MSASVSGHLHASQGSQWTEVDALISASAAIVDTLDESYRRIGGAAALVGSSIVGDGMLTDSYTYSNFGVLDTRHSTMQTSDTGEYNVQVLNVQNATYSMTVQEYLDGQYTKAGDEFSAAVDTYIDAASIFARAVKINELATAASTSGDIQDARALQDYITTNNILLTNSDITTFNTSVGDVEEAVQLYSAVAIMKEDTSTVAAIQQDADAAGRDYIYANDAIFYTSNNNLQWGFTGPDGNTAYNYTRSVDMGAWLLTNQSTLRNAGNNSDFYTSGPTQNDCFFATSAQQSDANHECYTGSP